VIDLHCHILPGIDDGPADVEQSLALARELADDGVTVVAATPHVREDYPAVVLSELAKRRDELAASIEAEGIRLELIAGGEVDLSWAIGASDEDLRLASFGQRGRDLLLESPYGPLPETFEDLVFALRVKGFRILLAHPERNPTFQDSPARLQALAEQGVLIQVTASALMRRPSESRSARLVRELLTNRLAHVVASDHHGPAMGRRRSIAAARDLLVELDPGVADWVLRDVPAAILAGEPVPAAPPKPRRTRGFWRRRLG
jgi:protein-tyrosine phosphatase